MEKKCVCGSTCFSVEKGKYDENWGLVFNKCTCKECGLEYTLARCPCGCYESFRIDTEEKQPIDIKQGFINNFFFNYDVKQDDLNGQTRKI